MEFNLLRSLYFLPGIIIGLTVHEFCHAYVAKQCGDTTSEEQGRITLNPLKHIDPMGFIFLIIVGFGWAKPVQFDERNLRNPKYDIMKIAIAGPLSNAAVARTQSKKPQVRYNENCDSRSAFECRSCNDALYNSLCLTNISKLYLSNNRQYHSLCNYY